MPKRIAIDLGSTKQQKPFAVIEGYRADELVVAVTNSATMANTASTPNVQTVDPAALELSFWDTIKNSNNPDDFKAYLDKYPDGQFAALARSRSQATRTMGNTGGGDSMEMVYWNAIKDSRNPSDFRGYVTKFPGGLFVELANNRIASLEAEGRDAARAKEVAAEEERRRNTRIFEVKDAGGTDGSLTVTPGTLSFEPKKANAKKNLTIECAQIKRIEAGKSVYQPPHVNIYLAALPGAKERTIVYYTASGGTGLFVKTPIVDITSNVIDGVVNACKMVRMNQ